MGRLRVGLVFGGASVEHEVSVVSARGVLSGFDPGRIDCIPIGVTESGSWLPPDVSRSILEGEDARVERPGGADAGRRLLIGPGGDGILEVEAGGAVRPLRLDVVFPLVHGWGGEDGRIQGLLELAGIPYVGAGVLGSAAAMDKEFAKHLFERHGLPVGPWISFRRRGYRRDAREVERRLIDDLRFPMFVKPACGGSSVGISKVAAPEGLRPAIEAALSRDDKVLAEAAMDAREVECSVLGNDVPEASVPGEIVPSREFYDYAAKYEDGTSRLLIPAPVGEATAAEVRRLAKEAFTALDVSGLARVDFFVERGSERVLLNEVNTLPGFTPISMFPKLWEASGLPYPRLLERLLELGLERWAAEQNEVIRRRV